MSIPVTYVAIIVIISIIISFFMILGLTKKIGQWGIFAKAGVAEWKTLIPIYNQVQLLKICKLPSWLVILYLDFIIPMIGLMTNRDVKWITIIMLVGLLCYRFMISARLGYCYKKGSVFPFFMGLFPSIFYPIIGWSKNEKYTELVIEKNMKKVNEKNDKKIGKNKKK